MRRLDSSTALAVLRIATGLLTFPHGLRKLLELSLLLTVAATLCALAPSTRFSLDGRRAVAADAADR